jgi:hypothetical protein
MSLTVGVVAGGPEGMTEEVRSIILRLREELADTSIDGWDVNLVFFLPGTVRALDFDGVRVGRMSRQRRLIKVDIAVSDPKLPAPQLQEILRAAVQDGLGVARLRLGTETSRRRNAIHLAAAASSSQTATATILPLTLDQCDALRIHLERVAEVSTREYGGGECTLVVEQPADALRAHVVEWLAAHALEGVSVQVEDDFD